MVVLVGAGQCMVCHTLPSCLPPQPSPGLMMHISSAITETTAVEMDHELVFLSSIQCKMWEIYCHVLKKR